MERIDSRLFVEQHYLGKPAEWNDRIVTRRVHLVKNFPDFCGEEYDLVDIGCGNGASMFLLAGHMRSCSGLEVYEGHRTAFDQMQKRTGIRNCSFQVVDIEKTPPARLYDRLISFEVIEHLTNEQSVQYYFDTLRPGGLAAISVPNKWWIFETHGAKLPKVLPWNRVPFLSWLPTPLHERIANARIYTQERITNLLASKGFEILKVAYITAPLDVLKESALKRWLVSNVFTGETTSIPFLSTAILVIARKPEQG